MEAGSHFGFILAAYVAAVAIVAALIAWVMVDYRVQRRRLADLEEQGATRRSASGRSGPSLQQAKEEA